MRRLLTVLLFVVTANGVIGSEANPNVPEWLKDAAIYHIYPSSFKDSDGDGIGDLDGIRAQLDYVKSLGMTAIWLSPVFQSEWKDGGYDITDFYRVDSRFGTNVHLVQLVKAAHEKGIRLMLDLVAGHTSDKHPWFIESRSKDTELLHSEYYIWTKDTKTKPKNYVSSDAPRTGNYMKNFFECQPALNYGYAKPNPKNPWEQSVDAPGPKAVREELKQIIAFWMDKGVDGFRVDMASSLIKNDPGKVENQKLWREIRQWFEAKYPEGVLMSEWSNPKEAIQGGFHIDLLIHNGIRMYRPLIINTGDKMTRDTCYFAVEGLGQKQFQQFIDHYTEHYTATRNLGYPTMPTCSHDIWRLNAGSRNTSEQLRVALGFFFTMPWPPILYYGEEIGMKNLWYAPEKEGSKSSRNRSAVRTPMQWTSGLNAGFSTAPADQLYLPIDTAKSFPNVEQQENDPNSQLQYVKQLLALRKAHPALGTRGAWELLSNPNQAYPMVYLRSTSEERLLVVINPSGKAVSCEIPSQKSTKPVQIWGAPKSVRYKNGKASDALKVNPVSFAIYRL